MSLLSRIGLYSDDIERAYEICEDTLSKVLLSDKWELVDERIRREIAEADVLAEEHPTNAIIEIMFSETERVLTETYPNLCDYYVNGYDSHFEVMGIAYFEMLLSDGVNRELIKSMMASGIIFEIPLSDDQVLEVAKNEQLVSDMIAVISSGGYFESCFSAEELGESEADNGCREEDDTDESFGLFLLQSYKDGNSGDTVYYEFQDGTIISGTKR